MCFHARIISEKFRDTFSAVTLISLSFEKFAESKFLGFHESPRTLETGKGAAGLNFEYDEECVNTKEMNLISASFRNSFHLFSQCILPFAFQSCK